MKTLSQALMNYIKAVDPAIGKLDLSIPEEKAVLENITKALTELLEAIQLS